MTTTPSDSEEKGTDEGKRSGAGRRGQAVLIGRGGCAYMGPLPKAAERAGIEGLRAKRFPQAIAPEDFFRHANELRARFARLVNAPEPNRVATVPSVSYAVSTIARNTDIGPGRNVVIMHEQFPGNVYPWRRLVGEKGGDLRVVGPVGDGVRGEGWTERILVAGYKWLLGPYSLSLAWFGERYLDGIPLEETWIGRRDSENFAGLVDYADDYQPGALRFDVGQRSNFTLIPALSASLDLVLEWRPERVSAYCRALMEDAFPRLRELGLRLEEDRWRSPHLFGLGLPPGADTERLKESLARHRVGVSFRGSSVRVSPNVYNHSADVDALAAAFVEGVTSR